MRRLPFAFALLLAALLPSCASRFAAESSRIPTPAQLTATNDYFARFDAKPAPRTERLILRKGDRLAVCGDSITEQKMYSRVIETYLTVCVPDLEITVRQFGWSGEKADGFLARMTNDVLRFEPTIATTCYGMNDHLYRPYEEEIGERYRSYTQRIVDAFRANDVRVVLGSPGCVGKRPNWSQATNATAVELNQNLCELRNIGISIAREEGAAFADVFWPMLVADYFARTRHGTNYAVAGKDGVHPGWSGSFIMAYAFLSAFGLDGEIGTFTVDLDSNQSSVSPGHDLLSDKNGELRIRSGRYPFCATGPADNDNSIRSAMTLVPFNQDLNRLILRVRNARAASYEVTWGEQTRTFPCERLSAGINLAAEFPDNPFLPAFEKVDQAVAAKQAYETRQIKQLFRSPEAKADMEEVAAKTEEERAPLARAIREAFQPVSHTIRIVPGTADPQP